LYPISLSSIKAIENLVSIENFQKMVLIIQKGAHNKEEYFVLDGMVRSYILNPQVEEVTIPFFCSNFVLTPPCCS